MRGQLPSKMRTAVRLLAAADALWTEGNDSSVVSLVGCPQGVALEHGPRAKDHGGYFQCRRSEHSASNSLRSCRTHTLRNTVGLTPKLMVRAEPSAKQAFMPAGCDAPNWKWVALTARPGLFKSGAGASQLPPIGQAQRMPLPSHP